MAATIDYINNQSTNSLSNCLCYHMIYTLQSRMQSVQAESNSLLHVFGQWKVSGVFAHTWGERADSTDAKRRPSVTTLPTRAQHAPSQTTGIILVLAAGLASSCCGTFVRNLQNKWKGVKQELVTKSQSPSTLWKCFVFYGDDIEQKLVICRRCIALWTFSSIIQF